MSRLDARMLGAGLVVLGAASAVAVAIDADAPPAVLGAALLGLALGVGLAGRTRSRSIGTAMPAGRGSTRATFAVLVVGAVVWLAGGTLAASALDAVGVPKRSELFALLDGLVAAAGVLVLRSRPSASPPAPMGRA